MWKRLDKQPRGRLRILVWPLAVLLAIGSFAVAQEGSGEKGSGAKGSGEKGAPINIGSTPDPVVEAIVNAPRTTPAESVRTIFVLSDLGQTELARPILGELTGQQLDDATLAALVEEFGSAKFLRLASDPVLGPAARPFIGKCMAAAAAQSRSPQRLAEVIERLDTDNDQQRREALTELKTTGRTGAQRLLAALAASDTKPRQNRLRKGLVALAPTSTPLLVAALDSDDEQLTTQATVALAEIGDPQHAALLAALATLAPAESELAQAAAWAVQQITGQPNDFRNFEALTSRQIERYLDGGPAASPDAESRVPVSQWNADTKSVDTVLLPTAEAGIVLAAPLAGAQALALGDRPDLVRRALVVMLESQAILRRAGLKIDPDEMPIDGVAPDQLSTALDDALGQNRYGAAVALCDALAEAGDFGVLATANARPAPLAAALDASHPAVRFAAVRAIIELNPPAPFPGSSRVVPTLEHFARGEGTVIAIVAMPNYDRAANLGGRLGAAGIRSRVTNQGREAVQLANTGADVAAVFVDMAILDPPVRETVFRLRRQVSTAGVPIALTAGAGRLGDAERIAREHTGVYATPRPHNDAAVLAIVRELASRQPVDWPDEQTRALQAKQAREWTAKLRNTGPSFYNLLKLRDAGEPGSGSRPTAPLPPAPSEAL